MKRLIALIAVLATAGICGLMTAASSHPASAATRAAATTTVEGVITASNATGSATFSPPFTGSNKSKLTMVYYPRQVGINSWNLPWPLKPWRPTDSAWAINADGSLTYAGQVYNTWSWGITASHISISATFTTNAAGNEAVVLNGTAKGSFAGPAHITLNSTTTSSEFNSELQNGGVSKLTFTSGAVMVGTSPSYTLTTLDNQADPTFNRLLGINSNHVIAGYFGSGAAGDPSKGYLFDQPYSQANYINENYPGSSQTQVAAVNNLGDSAGSFTVGSGGETGFVDWNGVFATLPHPCAKCKPGPYEILGLNDSGTAVGWYTAAKGRPQAYKVNQATGKTSVIKIPGAISSAATGINDAGDIVGYATSATGVTSGWLLQGGRLTTLQYPGGSGTQALGVNEGDEVVGSYLDSAGVQHGFTLLGPLTASPAWQSIDDPSGIGSTVVNGVNDYGALAGYYTDPAGNTDGMLATP